MKKILIGVSFIIVCIAIYLALNKNLGLRKVKQDIKIDIFSYVNVITNREILNVDGKIYIGNNKKELENGFYDIKVEEDVNKIKLSINSLSKNIKDERFNADYCLEVCKYINIIFENNIDTDILNSKLSQSYLKLRQDYNLDDFESVSYNDGEFSILLYESGNELCLEIGK